MGRSSSNRRKPDRLTKPPADPVPVTQEIERLEALDLAALRVQFRNRTGKIAPARISRSLLLRMLAYRIQVDRFGGLKSETRRLLDRIATAGRAATAETDAKAAVPAIAPFDRPRPGAVLVREWQGRMQHVMVLAEGFAWNGHNYPSLSAVALAITGTKWNGRRFFGVGPQPAEASSSGPARDGRRGDSADGPLPRRAGGKP